MRRPVVPVNSRMTFLVSFSPKLSPREERVDVVLRRSSSEGE